MKTILKAILLMACVSCFASAPPQRIDNLVSTNIWVVTYDSSNHLSGAGLEIHSTGSPNVHFFYDTAPTTDHILSMDPFGNMYYNGSIKALGLNLQGNGQVSGNLTIIGTLNTTATILWQTNIVWSTNAFFAQTATNTPDLNPIPETASVNIWSGSSNIFTKSVYLNGPVYVNGSSGGTSNVSTGGITFHFVNGFYTGNSVP